ncbi:fatty acid desaturase [Streptomyces sp. NBC_01408]|uniref:fatty acid desaturase n=1 Tax=Streptomyces sp. NBC_01408 TaxID=2903855 RepID=UPI00224E4E5B|nr:fatty acid desaturase [Streptomyces sp. NBC_01408]MCX4692538.1 fatty acid desaturase [Streptomyces sp. NBC_01408]
MTQIDERISTSKVDQPDASTAIRASFQRFPRWTQHLWTWITGKALPGQKPLVKLNVVTYVILDLVGLAVGIGSAWWIVSSGPTIALLLLPLCWVVTVSAARICSTVIAHHCMHTRFTGKIKYDREIAQVLSTLVCTEDADQYYEDHINLHHRKETFATIADPTIQHLLKLGFRPGMTVPALWRRLAFTVVSPMFHAEFLATRLAQNLWRSATYRRIMSLAYLGAVIGLVTWQGAWLPFALAVLVPMIPLYQIVALLEFLSEHAWFKAKDDTLGGRAFHVSHSWGRFNGDALPEQGIGVVRSVGAWSRWTLRLAFYHLPSRILVVPGDLAAHDFHHRKPSTFEWVRASYARQADIDAGHPKWPAYTDVWGLGVAIDRVFTILSEEEESSWELVRAEGPLVAAE